MVNGERIGLELLDEVTKVDISAVRFADINPKEESIVETARIQNLLVAPSEVIRRRGNDPEETWKRIAKDRQAMIDAGIPEKLIDDMYTQNPAVILAGETE